MKFEFNSAELRHGLSIAKLVKPMTNDYVLKVVGGRLVIYSYDKRKCARAEIRPLNPIPDDFTSDDHFLPADRQAFLESELTAVTITVTDKGMLLKAEGDKQSHQAIIKRCAQLSRRPPMPPKPSLAAAVTLPAKDFEELLRQVSCSALVRETKTEEAMRVNQVHFYPDKQCAFANARFYATVATMPGLEMDLSIVSADLPLMKSFCGKFGGKSVQVGQTDKYTFICDHHGESHLLFSRVASNKPPLSLPPEDGHEVVISIDRNQLSKCLSWAAMCIEGTQRVTVLAMAEPDGTGTMEFINGKQEVSRMPVQFKAGRRLCADFPVKYLAGIVRYLGEGNAYLKFQHPAAPSILEISEQASDGAARARHFIQAMVERA